MSDNRNYVFDNLVHANVTSADEFQKPVMAKRPQCFSNSNAEGVLPSMTFEQIGARAAEFGNRCRDLLESDSHNIA